MQYRLHDYIEKVAAEIHRLGLERNTANEAVTQALKKAPAKYDESGDLLTTVEKAIEVDKMYAYYSARMGELRRQEAELAQAEQERESAYQRYLEKVRAHMHLYSGMQASPDVISYGGQLKRATEKVNSLAMIEVEDRYSLC